MEREKSEALARKKKGMQKKMDSLSFEIAHKDSLLVEQLSLRRLYLELEQTLEQSA